MSATAIPLRGPTQYQGRGQYYEVLNHFFANGYHVRKYASFKRIGDKQGWGAPQFKEGLELDRKFFFDLEPMLTQVGARLAELAEDGCEICSFKKDPAPGGMVSYMLVSWPTNRELERNRVNRTAKIQPKQTALPRELTPYRRPQPYHVAEVAGKPERTTTRHEDATKFELEFHVKPRPSTTPSTTKTLDLPLFEGLKSE